MRRDERKRAKEVTECPECDSTHIIRDYKRGEVVCEDCGLVIDEKYIDQGPEWRGFDSEQRERRARTGAPMTYTMHDKGLSTEIGWGSCDSYGKRVPARNRAQLYRLRKWQHRLRVGNAAERNLILALNEMNRIASALALPRSVRETAAVMYRRAVSKNLIRGRSIEGVAAAALYGACRKCNVPRTLKEVAGMSRMSRKTVGRAYRQVARKLQLKLLPTKPEDYISRFCSKLGLSGEVKAKTLEILSKAGDKELTSGKGPTGVAAAALYIACVLCNGRKAQREIAEVTGVTEVTIRNRYKELAKELGMEVPL